MGPIVITGAAGYLGGLLATHYAAARDPAQVRCVVRHTVQAGPLASMGCDVLVGDLADPSVCDSAVDGAELVIHAAARLGTGPRSEFFDINVGATERLARACAAGGARFVFVSSIEAYGVFAGRVLTEDQPHLPNRHAYSESKYAGEQAVSRAYRRYGGDRYTIVRPGMIYGPRSPYWTHRYLQRARAGSIGVLGGGGRIFPVHEADVVNAIATAAVSVRSPGQIYNLVNDEGLSWWDWAHAHHQLVQSGAPHQESVVALRLRSLSRVASGRAGYRRRFEVELRTAVIPHRKAHDHLGWRPRRFKAGVLDCATTNTSLSVTVPGREPR
ncbi:NAD-dependent epimerase/dehydratase family protein [Nocardia tengchongensis]|uniref:NAD-dependent epimerase/dehydratase family protein n=1 Tax=Nocardia tengchongensis TaxID=2055889 RepID=UPI0036A0F4D4